MKINNLAIIFVFLFITVSCSPAAGEVHGDLINPYQVLNLETMNSMELIGSAADAVIDNFQSGDQLYDDLLNGINQDFNVEEPDLCAPTLTMKFLNEDGTNVNLHYLTCNLKAPRLRFMLEDGSITEILVPIEMIELMQPFAAAAEEMVSEQEGNPSESEIPLPAVDDQSINFVQKFDLDSFTSISLIRRDLENVQDDNIPEELIFTAVYDTDILEMITLLDVSLPAGDAANCIKEGILLFEKVDQTVELWFGCSFEEPFFLVNPETQMAYQLPEGFVDLIKKWESVYVQEPDNEIQTEAIEAVAIYGYIQPGPSSVYPGELIVYPEGLGTMMINPQSESQFDQLDSISGKEPPNKNAHFWGEINWNPEMEIWVLDLEKMRVDGPGEFFDPDPVEGWTGTIHSNDNGVGGFLIFEMDGEFAFQYGLHIYENNDLQAVVDSVVDQDIPVKIWGELRAGIPDWNGTQIRLERIEVVE